ncbi:MAG: carboxymuconolactone decarboxylase family protein [Bacteroidales bacterium]|mgnify:CR=1 FL=1|jgi:alkylhydroperoxidase/carboxymuconolactone decarboxylase family protein YurZ|nr:carboxymuconolactone decarboxylase family protein [Bacteroidales bacterium]NPV37584.1 carboxymuconolactone decarboxylase family protein [Bacteroidales bacterium]
MSNEPKVSQAFMSFAKNAPEHQKIWMEAVQKLSEASKLDKKTNELAYIAVLAALRLEGGIPFHVKHAKSLGASRDEVINAILVGLPAAGNVVIQSIPIAVQAYDEND